MVDRISAKNQFSSSAYVHKAVHEYRDAPAHRNGETQKLRVLSVEPCSVAGRIGLKPGDEIEKLNGKPLLDVIDFQFNAAIIGRRTILETQDRKITFVRKEWESFGLEFEPIEPLTCKNQCVFCFVHQNPKNVRRSLHIKDEDYRLSFLFGNYLTLTNVNEDEMQRLVHARIQLHCQVVLCPDLNDGPHLERTIDDLVRFHPGVASLAIVPVGLT